MAETARPSPGARPPVGRLAAAAFAAGLVALGAYGLLFLGTLSRRLPSAADWQQVAARLAREARPGDAVALAPWWAERARAVLPEGVPVLAFPRLAGEALPGVARVWVVALPRAPGGAGDVERDLATRGRRALEPVRIGALALTRFDLAPPLRPLFRLSELPGVRRETRDVDHLPRSCAVVEARPGRGSTLSFPGVPLGKKLRVDAALIGEAAFWGKEPIGIDVALDGRGAGRVVVPVGAPAFHRLEVDTTPLAGRRAELTLHVRTGRREASPLCLEAWSEP